MIVPLMYVNGRANGLTSHMLHAMDPNRITLKTTVCEDTLVMVKVEQISAFFTPVNTNSFGGLQQKRKNYCQPACVTLYVCE